MTSHQETLQSLKKFYSLNNDNLLFLNDYEDLEVQKLLDLANRLNINPNMDFKNVIKLICNELQLLGFQYQNYNEDFLNQILQNSSNENYVKESRCLLNIQKNKSNCCFYFNPFSLLHDLTLEQEFVYFSQGEIVLVRPTSMSKDALNLNVDIVIPVPTALANESLKYLHIDVNNKRINEIINLLLLIYIMNALNSIR